MNRLLRAAPKVIVAITVTALVVVAYFAGAEYRDQQDLNDRLIDVNERLHEVNVELERRTALRTHQICEANNETRQVLALVLDTLAAPRDDDEPGEHAERMRLRARVDPHLQPHECPPRPEEP